MWWPQFHKYDCIVLMAAVFLHTDLITAILVKLPVKSLFRFKCVSKQWNNLISSPYFVGFHRKVWRDDETSRRLLFIHRELSACPQERGLRYNIRFITTDIQIQKQTNEFTVEVDRGTKVVCSGFDLVCLFHYGNPTVFVCNPATHDVFVLPSVGKGMFIASDFKLFGFAYLGSTNNEYMVVRIVGGTGRFGAEILKFDECSSSSWRMAKNPYPDYFQPSMVELFQEWEIKIGPFMHRNMHWIICERRLNETIFILTFDVDQEILHKIDVPMYNPIVGEWELFMPYELVDLNGKLGLSNRIVEDGYLVTMSLWDLGEKQSSTWLKKYTIEFDCLKLNNNNLLWTRVHCLCLSDGQVLIAIGNDTLYLYNIEKKLFKQVEMPIIGYQKKVMPIINPVNELEMWILKESMFHLQGRKM